MVVPVSYAFPCALLHLSYVNLISSYYTEPIPDISDKLAPSKWGDAATYFFFSMGGFFLGGEIGFVSGTASASRTITKNPKATQRIEQAFKNYRIDALKQEIKQLEGKSKFEQLFRSWCSWTSTLGDYVQQYLLLYKWFSIDSKYVRCKQYKEL